MPGTPIPPAVLEAARRASAVEPELLNSERIEATFGSYGIDVVEDRPGLRLASLYSQTGDEKICRTFAAASLNSEHRELLEELEAIASGHSIGATFRRGGWRVAKKTVYTGTVPLQTLRPEVATAMRLRPPHELATHTYLLTLDKDGHSLDYAIILELHHPDYLSAAALSALFPETPGSDSTISADAIHDLVRLFELNR